MTETIMGRAETPEGHGTGAAGPSRPGTFQAWGPALGGAATPGDPDAHYRSLVELAPVAMLLVAADGRITFANRRAEGLFGYGPRELVGLGVEVLVPEGARGHHVAQRNNFSGSARGRPMGKGQVLHGRKRDGSIMPVEIGLETIKGADGTLVLAVVLDISTRVALEAQLRQAVKLEAVGLLAGGIAHDFNNMLSVILGYGQLLRSALAPHADHTARLDDIIQAAQRAAELTRQLLTFSRRQVHRPSCLDVNVVLGRLEKMLRRLLTEDIELSTELADGAWPIQADPGHLEQVVVNLVVNARDAMPGGGRLVLTTRNVELTAPLPAFDVDVPAGHWLALSVRDTGIGMDEATRARLFEPFFTTKPPGHGTGLGLSTVYGIVRQSGGHVTLETAPGRGSTFTVFLPRAEGSPTAVAVELPYMEFPGTGTVLLVEDSERVRDVVRASLETLGYRVVVAANATEAERTLMRSPTPVDYLLTDVVLPGISGGDLARRVRARWPSVKILLMSGHASEVLASHGGVEGGFAFLQKPVSLTRLGQALATLPPPPPPAGPTALETTPPGP